jgi:hypothetical protein
MTVGRPFPGRLVAADEAIGRRRRAQLRGGSENDVVYRRILLFRQTLIPP